uniref:Replicase n=1 Tax=Moussa virus TaxID=698672 RepID=D2E9Y2_9RHAB|nr:RNA polymerase [Moussa virus]
MDNEDYTYDNYQDPYDWDAMFREEDQMMGSTKKPIRLINNTDYNLNSPLIRDETDGYLRKIQGKTPIRGQGENQRTARAIKAVLTELGYNLFRLKDSQWHHKALPDMIYEQPGKLSLDEVLSVWGKSWDVATEPIKTTELTLTGTEVHGGSYTRSLRELKNPDNHRFSSKIEFEQFLNLHLIVCLMNSTSHTASKKIVTKMCVNSSFRIKEDIGVTIMATLNQNIRWIITPKVCVNLTSGLILDKNFIMMMKDICLARFLSTVTIKNRSDHHNGLEAVSVLRSLYLEGDNLVRLHGNKAYKCIKMVESECTERWNKLGNRHRPLIPLSTSLEEHLKEQEMSLSREDGIWGAEFLNIIRTQEDPWIIGQLYGAYRHWGHPYIEGLVGLKKLHDRVQKNLTIDKEFAEKLGSEMAFMVLEQRFKKEKRWYCTSKGLEDNSALKACIDQNIWPTHKVIRDFGDKWHTLELLPCFDLPDEIDSADMFSDKAHSLNRDDIIQHLKDKPNSPIPTKRVIETLLNTDLPSVRDFLRDINENGLGLNDLVIGLKEKERELKEEGRFFSLMGWKLRLYFVITEFLIKKFYVPMFKGLTMADDLNTVTKKLLKATEGQGRDDYDEIYIANSLDYDKWNNNQRYESNEHVFRVMGKFMGLPEIFAMTHKFFQQSLVYYCSRPDLMKVEGNTLVNVNPETPVCWNGQQGGFEGLRQKGWSVVNYLILRREIMTRNTSTMILAQGDNQIIIPKYKLVNKRNNLEMRKEINNVWMNNAHLMNRVRESTKALGLTINKDEVVTSAELLIYGKIPIYRGKIIALESKRWSRVSSVTNDQIPSLSNSVSSATTSAITVCQHSDDPIETMYQYGFVGSMVLALTSWYSPILGPDPYSLQNMKGDDFSIFVWRMLYKDPSLGGVCGTNLMRFLISRFPDPVCESLAWWKLIYHNTNSLLLKQLCLECGDPPIGNVNATTLSMLLEDPTSLNIPGTLSSNTLIKDQIYIGLANRVADGEIKNRQVRESINYTSTYKEGFVSWLFSITPVFPRFISEFYTGTYFKITEGIISIFQNSRTIRTVFSSEFDRKLQQVIYKSEESSVKLLKRRLTLRSLNSIWSCSSSLSDQLRKQSWGFPLIGATIPHPAEMVQETSCGACTGPHVVGKKTGAIKFSEWSRGPLMPYLGSKTSETTSVMQPWEKSIDISILRHACNMRRMIDWITETDDNVSKTIYNNIESLTGLNLKEEERTYSRTGSGQHRLRCSRVSNEGNPAVGFNNLMYIAVTTDSLGEINGENYDFMYQSLLCWAGILATLPTNLLVCSDTTHFHIKCDQCLRKIEDEKVSAPTEYVFTDVSEQIKRMIGNDIVVRTSRRHTTPAKINWELLKSDEKSWHLGRAQGFLWGLGMFADCLEEWEDILFPLSITNKVSVSGYMKGLHRGFLLGACLPPVYSRYGTLDTKAQLRFVGAYWAIITSALGQSKLPELINHKKFNRFTAHYGSSVIKSYPARKEELVGVLRKWFLNQMVEDHHNVEFWKSRPVVTFAEMDSDFVLNMFRIAEKLLPAYRRHQLGSRDLKAIKWGRKIIDLLNKQRQEKIEQHESKELDKLINGHLLPKCSLVDQEARKAASSISQDQCDDDYNVELFSTRGHEEGLGCDGVVVEYQPEGSVDYKRGVVGTLQVGKVRDPTIAGKRLIQLSTGAHYKLKDLLCRINPKGDGMFIGDGSGGMGACYLRLYPERKIIFNSLFQMEGESMKGVAPQGPGAYTSCGENVWSRCVNYSTCYQEHSDLSDNQTWETFLGLIERHKLRVGVICCDAEVFDNTVTDKIEDNIRFYVEKIFRYGKGIIIYKTYWERLLLVHSLAHDLGEIFETVEILMPDTQGSHTSEIYVVGHKLKRTKTTGRKIMTEMTMIQIHQLLKINKGDEQEFIRARSLNYETMCNGLELRVPFTDSVDVMEYLIGLGVKAGMALQVSNDLIDLSNNNMHPIHLMYALVYVISRDTINIETGTKGTVSVPASSKLQRLIAGLFGIWFGISELLQDYNMHKLILKLYQEAVSVAIYPIKRRKYTFTGWKIGTGGFTKVVDPGERAGVTQSMIRMINCLYRGRWVNRDVKSSDVSKLNLFLRKLSKSVTPQLIEERTGIVTAYDNEEVDDGQITYLEERED